MASRNDPCPCGSARKYKRCCLNADLERERAHSRLVEEVTGWTEKQYPGQIAASLREFLGEEREPTAEELNFIASWSLHERELPVGETPLERYAADGPDAAVRSLAGLMAQAKLSLWRVVDVTPGLSMTIEPYVGGERVRIQSANISKVVRPWDLIFGRLRSDVMELWGPSRCYSVHHEQELQRTIERLAHCLALNPDDVDRVVRRAPADLLNFRGPDPVPFTTEGDPVLVATARWRIDRTSVISAFDESGWLVRDDSECTSYGWLSDRRELLALKPDTLPLGAVTFESSPLGMPDVVALGTFYIEADELRYEGLSQRRLDWALEMIERMLPTAELIAVDTKTFEEARLEHVEPCSEPLEVPPEVLADMRASMTERWLSEPVPALEGLTPREAASSGAYRPQLRSLLRGIAARSQEKLGIDIDSVVADLGISP
jgi:hypothetical protein